MKKKSGPGAGKGAPSRQGLGGTPQRTRSPPAAASALTKQARREKHAEIAHRYGKKRQREPFSLIAMLAADVRRLIRYRQRTSPDDPIARSDFELLAVLMTGLEHGERRFRNFVATDAPPWFDQAADTDAVWAAATANPKRPTPREIAWHFEMTWADKTAAGIRSIGPAIDARGDRGRKLKADRRRELARRRKRRQREKSGTTTRAQYLAGSLSATRPWEAEGISRRTWYRRQGPKK